MEEPDDLEEEVKVEGRNFIGDDVISQDFMSRVRKEITYTDAKGRKLVTSKLQNSFAGT